MKFNEIQFFDTCDNLDPVSTDHLLYMFRMRFKKDFDCDMYDFIKKMETKDVVLILMICKRFMDHLLQEV